MGRPHRRFCGPGSFAYAVSPSLPVLIAPGAARSIPEAGGLVDHQEVAQHLQEVKRIHESDLAVGWGRVLLPDAPGGR